MSPHPPKRRDQSKWRGSHPRRAKAVTSAAYANPNTLCWRCGKVLDHPDHRYRDGRPSVWHADHVDDTDPRSALMASASLCNETAGGVRRRAMQLEERNPRSPNAPRRSIGQPNA
jgi:hypothetical protein